MKNYLLLIIILFVINALEYSNAQENSAEITVGKHFKIYSDIIGEERDILISLPFGYDRSNKEYPVIYRLDGSIGGLIVSGGLIKYLSLESIPEMICVMIPNTDRGRDLSILPMDQLPTSGGAENFLKFIAEELIPYIDENYRTTAYRIITGGSAGGEIVLYSLVKYPDVFDAYIAGSPAMFSAEYLLDEIKNLFSNRESLNKNLIIPTFDRDFTVVVNNIPKLKKIVQEYAPKDFYWEVIYHTGKAHVPGQYFLDGLKSIFRDWEPLKQPEAIPTSGSFPDGEMIEVELLSDEDEIRYTLNGDDPTRKSKLYMNNIVVDQPVTIKAKSFRNNLSESRTLTINYEMTDVDLPVALPGNLEPGLNYKYFEKRWFYLPESIDLDPVKSGIVSIFDNSIRSKEEGYLLQFDGFIQIIMEGRYRFYLKSSHDSRLLLGNKILIDCPGSKSSSDPAYEFEEYSYELNLVKGFYSIQLLFANAWFHDNILEVFYEGPGIEKQEIPGKVLWH